MKIKNIAIILGIVLGLDIVFYLITNSDNVILTRLSIVLVTACLIGSGYALVAVNKETSSQKGLIRIFSILGILVNLYFLVGWFYWLAFKDFGF